MVSVYGLNEVWATSYYDSRGENSFTKPYSEETAHHRRRSECCD